jgi:hypothetical protein
MDCSLFHEVDALIKLVLYSRSYCHLCDDMLEALKQCALPQPFQIEVVDVDLDESLVALYDELVPVLVGSRNGNAPVEICHYFLDEKRLNAFLSES